MEQITQRVLLAFLMLVSANCFAEDSEPTQNPIENSSEVPQDYENAFDLMKDFFDLSVKKDKGMKYWTDQLIGLIKKKSSQDKKKLKAFIQEFHQAHTTRNALGVGQAFQKHKDKFNEPKLALHIEKMIQKNGLNSLLVILKHRMNIKG